MAFGAGAHPVCRRNQAAQIIALIYSLSIMKESQQFLADPSQLLKLVQYRMPFGKYSGRLLIDLPEPYVIWFARKGFPEGELGRMMRILYEIKINGLEQLLQPLRH